jgi:hypothetical protein
VGASHRGADPLVTDAIRPGTSERGDGFAVED